MKEFPDTAYLMFCLHIIANSFTSSLATEEVDFPDMWPTGLTLKISSMLWWSSKMKKVHRYWTQY